MRATPAQVIDLGYVMNTLSGSISVVDTMAQQVIDEIALDGTLRDADIGPGGRFVFAVTRAPDEVVVIDLKRRRIAGRIGGIGALPEAISWAPDGRRVYVSSFGDDTVSVIDPARLTVTRTIAVGRGPNDLVVSRDSQTLYVSNHLADTISVIDARLGAVRATVPSCTAAQRPCQPTGMALAPDNRSLYVVNYQAGTMAIVDTRDLSVRSSIAVDILPDRESFPSSVAVTPDGRFAYLSNFTSGAVLAVDLASERPRQAIRGLGPYPADLTVSPKGDCVYVSEFAINADRTVVPGSVAVIETASNEIIGDALAVGFLPVSVKFASTCPGDCRGDGEVTVDELVTAVGLLLNGTEPGRCPGLDADGSKTITVAELVGAVDRTLLGCSTAPAGADEPVFPATIHIAPPAQIAVARCGVLTCADDTVCVRDLDCHLRGCPPRDTCCRRGDDTCGVTLP